MRLLNFQRSVIINKRIEFAQFSAMCECVCLCAILTWKLPYFYLSITSIFFIFSTAFKSFIFSNFFLSYFLPSFSYVHLVFYFLICLSFFLSPPILSFLFLIFYLVPQIAIFFFTCIIHWNKADFSSIFFLINSCFIYLNKCTPWFFLTSFIVCFLLFLSNN